MSNTGRTCKVHYTGTFNDGTKFDSSYDRGEPIEFVCGAGQMIPGFDQAVEGMNVGDIIDVHLRPEDAYGMLEGTFSHLTSVPTVCPTQLDGQCDPII